MAAEPLDQADRILLDQLQTDATQGIDALAHACGLSVASVQRRLKRLRVSGAIAREVAQLEPAAVGMPMTFVIMVELERERREQLADFRARVRDEPQVQQAYYVTGESDFALVCVAKDMADFEALTHRLFFENGNVRRFRTSVVMERTKVGLSVPV
ncbi:Lrp/AsnC family transcriptional regulator [Caulobacter sp.]|uniref:Lrp/AsnC family transcriptional regulator n=1 Tax=Caulobacter sp. TaxID=78 RepID=UPI001B05A864|nr:Lrp/AsnC family transcriptional regulator [Caulobacter sp.]MBO9545953.1 Lrp/AsnC family transcriptional regulator [Caulobacter sp.]